MMDYQRLYEYRFKDIQPAARLRVWAEITPFIHRLMGEPQRVLDPAAGNGEYIQTVAARERWAVDAYFSGHVSRDGDLTRLRGNILDIDIPPHYFDGIFVSNFLEHLKSQDQVCAFLSKMHRSLRPGGCIAILGPNFKYCAGDYFDCADHILPLTHLSVEELLYASGFELKRSLPRFLPYSFRSVLPASSRLTRAYLNVPLAWKLLGKQFLVLATRNPEPRRPLRAAT